MSARRLLSLPILLAADVVYEAALCLDMVQQVVAGEAGE